MAISLREETTASFAFAPDGLAVTHRGATQTVTIPWAEIAFVQRRGRHVEIGRRDAAALRTDTISLPCPSAAAAVGTYEAIELARKRPDQPFRRTP